MDPGREAQEQVSAQVAILGTAEDVREILAAASKLNARAVPERIPLDDPPELHDPLELFERQPGQTLYLLPEDLAAVEVMAIEAMGSPGTATVNDRTSPVVELIPPGRSDDALTAGRLYLGLSSSHSLYSSAKRLFDGLVKATDGWPRTTRYDVRVGPAAAAAAKSDGPSLESMSGERLTLNDQ
jgi:hypothetical protein